MKREKIIQFIDDKKDVYCEASDEIWSYAETKFEEYKSSEKLKQLLSEEGFSIETAVADMPTAFVASFGKGKPVIGLLAEYDALPNLSQISKTSEHIQEIPGGNGHGCGHHLLGMGSVVAAIAVKKWMESEKIEGTIRLYGCPAEEGGSGKAYMVRAKLFEDVDAALSWHPFAQNGIFSTTSLANCQAYFRFFGKSSHAAASPHLGRSALDAVELMNVGANYLREHVPPEVRFHYAITDTGGKAPNVVQGNAEVLYLIRSPKLDEVDEIYNRICNIAKGAALMTETRCEIKFDKGCSNLISNETLETILHEEFQYVGAPVPNEEDMKYGKEIRKTLTNNDIQSEINQAKLFSKGLSKEYIKIIGENIFSDRILPYTPDPGILPGSTDVGDVSWVVPTGQAVVASYSLGTPGHSWQLVAQGKSDFAHEGMLTAGKVLALSSARLFLDTDILKKAKSELEERLSGNQYRCPIPDDVMPG